MSSLSIFVISQNLPTEIQRHIFEMDPTYRIYFQTHVLKCPSFTRWKYHRFFYYDRFHTFQNFSEEEDDQISFPLPPSRSIFYSPLSHKWASLFYPSMRRILHDYSLSVTPP